MRLLAAIVLGVIGLNAHAENPYAAMSAPELRVKIAKVDAVQEQSWYQVEVLAFARTGPTTQEFWRLDQRPQLVPENAIHPDSVSPRLPEGADSIDNKAAQLGAWRTLPADRLILTDMLKRMEKHGGYRTLYHNSWVQPVRERSAAFPIYIEGGKRVTKVSTSSSTTDADLDYGLPPIETPTATAALRAEDMSADAMPTTQAEFQGMLKLHLSRYLHVEPELWFTRNSEAGQAYWVRINQNRRMRSEELHYLDHPLFGMLLRITPYQTEQQVQLELMKQALKAK